MTDLVHTKTNPVYIVREKNGGMTFKLRCDNEYHARVLVAHKQNKTPDDYFAYQF